MMSDKHLVAMVDKFLEGRVSVGRDDLRDFAHLFRAEQNRVNAIENTRMGCAMNGGHEFVLRDGAGFGGIVYGSGQTTVTGWKGTAMCANCDAVLAATYREEL